MKVDLLKLSNAVNNIKVLTSDINGTQYIMLDITKDLINVCYSDGRISYIEKIDAEYEDGDIEEKVVVDLDALITKLDMYRPVPGIEIDPLSLKLDGVDSIVMNCRKFMNQIQYDENNEMIDNGQGEALTTRIDSSNIHTNLKYHKVGDSIKFSMTTRMNYEAIFEGDGWVTCGVTEFKNMLNKLSKTDGSRECYLSPKRKAGFAVGTGYTAFLPVEFDLVASSLHTTSIKKLSTIISKFKSETINLLSEQSQFTKITTDEGNIGIVFEQCPPVKQQMATLGTFESLDYTGQGLLFNKAVLADMVRGTLLVSGSEMDTDMGFSLKGDIVVASTIKKGTGNGIDNLEVFAYSVIGDASQFVDYKISLSFKLLQLILNNCDGNAIEFGFASTGEDEKYLRITDIAKKGSELKPLGYFYMCV